MTIFELKKPVLRLTALLCLLALAWSPVVLADDAADDAADAAAEAAAKEKLPVDPAILTGKLDNGLTWMYRRHDNPPGRMAFLLHVDTGSLNEAEEERGLSHFMEHMMFNGSENFPPGELIPYFESLGMEFGADVNAMTGFDQTAYMIFTPDTEMPRIDRALLVLSDYAFRCLLPAEEIEKERGVILEEMRAHHGVEERLQNKLWPELFAGSRLAERLIIGTKEVIEGAGRDRFEKYYRTWYRPERMTVILVGDADPKPILPLIEKHFGSYRASLPAGEEHGVELKPFTGQRAIVVTDPELVECSIQMMEIHAGRGPTTTVAGLRAEIVDVLAGWIMERRFEDRVRKGEASYQNAGAGVFGFFNDALMANGSASGKPALWKEMFTEMIVTVKRARDHGFTAHELELAKKEILAMAEREVRTEPTRSARSFLMEMSGSVGDGEPMISAAQSCALVKKLLPTIPLEEVSARFSEHFAPGTFSYVLTIPEKEGVSVPDRKEILLAARAALAMPTEPIVEEGGTLSLLATLPEPGKVVETSCDEDLGITQTWLENGVRLHHRFMDYKKDSVWVSISFAGGQIEETEANAGVTHVASLVFSQPATGRLASSEITDLMTGKNIAVKGAAEEDSLTVTVSGSPRDLEAGLQLTHALFTDGRIEETAFDLYKTQMAQQLEYLRNVPEFQAHVAMSRITAGGDVRLLPPTVEIVNRQTLAAGQAWFERICREAPIEVAVVGEITLDDAMTLVARYVGSLPARERSASRLDGLRRLKRDSGPFEERVTVETITPKGMVMFGFLGCDRKERLERRALNLAAQTLSSRLIKEIREEKGLVYSIGASFQLHWAYEDLGVFMTGAPCDPLRVDDVLKAARGLFADFAGKGPTAEELEIAKKQMANKLDNGLKEPAFWWNVLQHIDLQGNSLDDYKNLKEAYEAYTAVQVRDAFAKYYKPERIFSVIAEPKAAPEADPKKDS
jgi:zinc protease